MSRQVTDGSYGAVARFLHWATALVVLFLLGLGLYMEGLDFSTTKLSLYGLHKSFGFLVLGLVVVRILWRAGHAAPAALPTHAPWERLLARVTHIFLYLGLLGMPLSGWLMSGAADFPHTFFNLFSMPDIVPGKNEALFGAMRTAHGLCGWALIAAIALHAAGALKHHLLDRDATLRRMLFDRPVAGFALLLGLMAAGVGLYYMKGAPHEMAQSAAVEAEGAGERALDLAAETIDDAVGDNDVVIAAPHWTIDREESYAAFTATVQGSDFTGRFGNMAGEIRFDPANLAGSFARVSVDIDSVASGSKERDEAMVLPSWFDAASFPRAVFESTSFTHQGGDSYRVQGRLTIRDVSLPVGIPFTLRIDTGADGNNLAKMEGAFGLQRLDYGVGQGEWAGTGMVANAVNVRVFVTARRESP